MLSVHNITKSFDRPVIKNFSYTFPDKGLVLIRGASGCGKTTLMQLLAGLEMADAGKIEKKEGALISCVFQEARLVPHLNLLQNILLVKKKKEKQKALEYLSLLGLEKDADKAPAELSGGMRLRGAIARSLYYGGDIYLWDEPTKELDPENRKKVIDIILELAKDACVIVVTHDPDLKSEREIHL